MVPLTLVAALIFTSILSAQEKTDKGSVDLTDRNVENSSPLQGKQGGHVLGRPWHENIHISGFAAVGLIDTGDTGTRPDAGFLIKESSLFIEADVWENVSAFFEIQVNRLGKDDSLFTRTGEVYLHARELLSDSPELLNIKVGRIDIPFGEEYLWQDAIDNPMITQSAAYPYGFDEGLLAHGSYSKLDYVFSITDGTDTRSKENNSSKSYNLKLGTATDVLDVSVSVMRQDAADKSAFEFGGSHFQPVGASHSSSLGSSPSGSVDAWLYELDAKLDLGKGSYVSGFVGSAQMNDDAAGFDRSLTWYMLQPYIQLTDKTYIVARWSEIGTYKGNEGYHFDGKVIAGGNSAYGYDAKRLQRISLGLGWRPNPNMTLKFEIGRDRFWLIDAASANPGFDKRLFVGLELVVRF